MTCSENQALPANKKSVQVVFQLNTDLLHQRGQGGLHCTVLNYESRLCYYKDAISLNSQAGQ